MTIWILVVLIGDTPRIRKKAARLEHAARVYPFAGAPARLVLPLAVGGAHPWRGGLPCKHHYTSFSQSAPNEKISPPPELYLLWAVPKPSSGGGASPYAQLHVQGMHVCNLTRHTGKSCNSSRVTRNHRPSRDFALIILRSILRVRLSAPVTSIGTHISLSRE